jgi:hypothetical protein
MQRRPHHLYVVSLIGLLVVSAGGVLARAQQATPATVAPSARPAQAPVQTPLKLTVVITRHQGEREVSRLPYELTVYPGQQTALNMRLEVPVSTGVHSGSAPSLQASFQYRRVGTSITAGATALDDGRFQVQLTVDEARVIEQPAGAAEPRLPNGFSSFESTTPLLLRDGQTLPFTAATDPVSGEVARISVTLNVIKEGGTRRLDR